MQRGMRQISFKERKKFNDVELICFVPPDQQNEQADAASTNAECSAECAKSLSKKEVQ
jgi:hypothetical protein